MFRSHKSESRYSVNQSFNRKDIRWLNSVHQRYRLRSQNDLGLQRCLVRDIYQRIDRHRMQTRLQNKIIKKRCKIPGIVPKILAVPHVSCLLDFGTVGRIVKLERADFTKQRARNPRRCICVRQHIVCEGTLFLPRLATTPVPSKPNLFVRKEKSVPGAV